MFKILIFFWIFLLLISIFYVINNLMQKKENFNVSEVENDINSRNKIYLETNVIDIIPGKPGPTGEKGNDGDDGTLGREGKDGLIGNSGNDGDDAATVQFINPDNSPIGEVSVRNPNTDDIHKIKIPYGKKGDRGDTRKLNFCYVYKNEDDTYNTNNYDCYLEDPIGGPDNSKDMYLYIPKGNKGDDGDQGDCSMESRGFPGPTGDTGPDGDKGEKGPRGLEGKRGIDANKLNFGHNITGVEYKICFGDTPEDCIDVPKLKAINQDYQDKIDNKPYEDIISNTNNKYVPVLLRRINRLKKDLCLAHLTGDYSNGYLNDIKKDLDETYNVFNQNEGTVFKSLYNNVDDLNNYCSRFFNIVAVDFVFDKTNQDDCTEVDLYTFIETYLKTQGKWDDRFNTYKNTPVINIIIDDKSTDIISNSIDKAALIIDVDKIFEIFPNIYEIILNVDRFITGKHGPSGAATDDWEGKEPDKLNGGKGQDGNAGGPAIDIIYDGTKEIIIRITEKDGSGTKIAGGFGSLGGAGGKASKSFTKQKATATKAKTPIQISASFYQEKEYRYQAPDPGRQNAYNNFGENAYITGYDGNGGQYSMVVFGKHHLQSKHEIQDSMASNTNEENKFWRFHKGEHRGTAPPDLCIYSHDNSSHKSHLPLEYHTFTYYKNPNIKKKEGVRDLCSNNFMGSTCRKVSYSTCTPRTANWHDLTAVLWQYTPATTGYAPCESGWIEDPVNTENCCKIDDTTKKCHINEKINEDGIEFPADHGSHTIGAPANYTAKDKEAWEIHKNEQKANDETPEYVPITINFTPSETINGNVGNRGTDGKDGDIISTNKIQDNTKVIIILNSNQLYL